MYRATEAAESVNAGGAHVQDTYPPCSAGIGGRDVSVQRTEAAQTRSVHTMSPHLSDRVSQNLSRDRLREVRSYCFHNQYDPVTNPEGIVAMAIAENKLMRDEITKHVNDHFHITPWVRFPVVAFS